MITAVITLREVDDMANPNPYENTGAITKHSSLGRVRSVRKWMLVGFAIGAATATVLGIYSLQSQAAYNASLAERGGIACGMGSLAALMAIVIGMPVLGGVGALVGFGLSKLPRQV